MKRTLAICLISLLGAAAGAQEAPRSASENAVAKRSENAVAKRSESASLRIARETLLAALAKKQVQRGLDGFLDRFNEQHEMIGERRRQELQVALFHLQREEFGLRLRDDPVALEETADIVRSCVFKILREEIESTLPFELALGRLEKHRDRLTPNVGRGDSLLRLRISPRFGVGSDSYVGAKLQLRGGEGPLNRFSLHLRQSVKHSRNALGLEYADGPWDVRLQHSFDALRSGHSFGFFARFRFSAE